MVYGHGPHVAPRNKAAFRNFERQIRDAFSAYVVRNDSAPLGGMRAKESFVKGMGRPGRRVVSFNTPNGPVDASGRFLH